MFESNFEKKFQELLNDTDLPLPQKEKLFLLARRSRENHQKLQAQFNNLQQSLDYLRLGIKYLIFDLEATRRENQALREKLNQEME
ncbi:MAG TPA: hypothetical protein PK054_07285 [Anaerohalosphaeraceae bacterium]|nr:hypothetical protein [Anaerohalosphaeraceae bacterium]HOL89180.1 hypothetical protein [Anaerohalosphaeraceae bacterium]HPP56371.1 hypothetical protein [Anaerohalosphaeraceae bacterium]